jgi:mRNA-degrading endonuclease YafQ of YafQ-DinJ toxin-antitoxin module
MTLFCLRWCIDYLQGNLKEYRFVSINLQYRIVLDFIITEKEIILLDIETHGEVN